MKNPTSLILLLLAIGIFYTFTTHQYEGAKALAAQAAEYRNVIDNVSRIEEARDNLLNSFETIPAAEKERLMKILPDNADSVGLARDLDTIAGRYGITVKSLQVDPPDNENARRVNLPDYSLPYKSSTVVFSFVSNYANFMKFLADLEKSLRLMDVRGVSFQVGEAGLYEHQVTVETYWLNQ